MNPASVVLVHGAWFDSTCWDAVIDDLKRLGATAVAVDLPLTGFDADVDAVRQAIDAAGPNVVVAAHSYGGCVVPRLRLEIPPSQGCSMWPYFSPSRTNTRSRSWPTITVSCLMGW